MEKYFQVEGVTLRIFYGICGLFKMLKVASAMT